MEPLKKRKNPAFEGASKEWLRQQIFGMDSKLDELRAIVSIAQGRVDFFENSRRELIDELADPAAYCANCRGVLIAGFSHNCPASK